MSCKHCDRLAGMTDHQRILYHQSEATRLTLRLVGFPGGVTIPTIREIPGEKKS